MKKRYHYNLNNSTEDQRCNEIYVMLSDFYIHFFIQINKSQSGYFFVYQFFYLFQLLKWIKEYIILMKKKKKEKKKERKKEIFE